MAKSSLEKALEKHQKEIERQFKKKIYAEKKLANKQMHLRNMRQLMNLS